MNTENRSGKLWSAILKTLYEYALIVTPILIYVWIEATHKSYIFLISSPEWAIATIFLNFQAISLYRSTMRAAGRRPTSGFLNGVNLLLIVIVIVASINAYNGIHYESKMSNILLRIVLLLVSSFNFFALVASAELTKIESKNNTDGE